MENDWNIMPLCVWQDIEGKIESLTASCDMLEVEISKMIGVMTRSKSRRLKDLENKLYNDTRMLAWYKKIRPERIQQTKIIIDQILDFGYACPTIQFEPFEYTCEEFCDLLAQCIPIADKAHHHRMEGFRCTLFH